MKCKALTSDGTQCSNKATYPEHNPVVCHIPAHRKQIYEKGEVKMKKEVPEVEKHIFASKALNHTVFVNYPEDDERDYFRAVFSKGKYTTDDDEKAKLLEESIKNSKTLSKKITKL